MDTQLAKFANELAHAVRRLNGVKGESYSARTRLELVTYRYESDVIVLLLGNMPLQASIKEGKQKLSPKPFGVCAPILYKWIFCILCLLIYSCGN